MVELLEILNSYPYIYIYNREEFNMNKYKVVKQEIRKLRRLGWSIVELEKKYGINRSTIHYWIKDLPKPEWTQDQLSARKKAQDKGRRAMQRKYREKRGGYQEQGRQLAKRGDKLHLIGCMLYWAEGARNKNVLDFCNSDPEMIRLYISFLGESLGVDLKSIKIHIMCYTDVNSVEDIEKHWLQVTGSSKGCLTKTTVNPVNRFSRNTRVGKSPYGTCAIRVYSTEVVQGVFGAIQEYIGADKPSWIG